MYPECFRKARHKPILQLGPVQPSCFFVTLTSNVKFVKYCGTILASPTAKLRGARPTAKLRGLSKTSQNAKFEHFEYFIFGQNYTNQNVSGMLQKGTAQANIAIGACSAIMFLSHLRQTSKFAHRFCVQVKREPQCEGTSDSPHC